jgi:hypothetical protein
MPTEAAIGAKLSIATAPAQDLVMTRPGLPTA